MPVMLLLACKCFLWFVAYSVAGWIWEVILFCFTDKRVINRGFLNGPICPIYGAGALAMWGIFGVWLNMRNMVLLFLLGGLLACVMEYLISYALEKMFHTRWWDYTRNRFNINGRVCLLGFTAFGGFCVLIVWLVQPFVIRVTDQIPDLVLYLAALISFITFGLDFVVTIAQLCKLQNKLRELQAAMDQKIYGSQAMQRLENSITPKLRRFAKAFPRMSSTLYDGALKRVLEKIRDARAEEKPPAGDAGETTDSKHLTHSGK